MAMGKGFLARLNRDYKRCPKCGELIAGFKKWEKHVRKCKAIEKKGLWQALMNLFSSQQEAKKQVDPDYSQVKGDRVVKRKKSK